MGGSGWMGMAKGGGVVGRWGMGVRVRGSVDGGWVSGCGNGWMGEWCQGCCKGLKFKTHVAHRKVKNSSVRNPDALCTVGVRGVK